MGLFKNYVYPVATLAGSTIGVGFFALPYVAMKAGIWLMLFYFVAITLIILLVNLAYGQLSLKTPDFKRFPGFVGYHLGKKAEVVALISVVIGSFGVLLAYLIVGGEFLTALLQPQFGGTNLLYTLAFAVAVSIIIFLGIQIISKVELALLIALFLSVIFIFAEGFGKIKISNIFSAQGGPASGWQDLFLPYGALFFAMWGTGLIPEVEEMIGIKSSLKKIILISTLIPAVFYVLFVFLILGITGVQTTDSALTGLKNFLGDEAALVALLAGTATTFVAFVTQGYLLEKTLVFDFGIKKRDALVVSCAIPLILFLLGLKSFVPLLSFVGAVLLGINGVLILLMYKKIGGKKIIIYPLSLVFTLGMVYELVYFFK